MKLSPALITILGCLSLLSQAGAQIVLPSNAPTTPQVTPPPSSKEDIARRLDAATKARAAEEERLRQEAAAAPKAAPATGVQPLPSAPPQPLPATPPKPEALKPENIKKAPASTPTEHTTIDCKDGAVIDTKTSVIIYYKDVEVKSPTFHLTTDSEFEVHMKKEDDSKKGKDGKDAPPPTAASAANAFDAKEDDNEADKVEFAIARGREVVIVRKDAQGNEKIGKGRSATYNGSNGDMVLRDWPQVQEGRNLIIATDASTTMTLTKEGKFKVNGPSRSDIVGSATSKNTGPGQAKPKPAAPPATTPGTSPGTFPAAPDPRTKPAN